MKTGNDPNPIQDALQDTAKTIFESAANFFGSASKSLNRFADDMFAARNGARDEKTLAIFEDTQKLTKLLPIYLDGWRSSSSQMKEEVVQEIGKISDDFLLDIGHRNSDKAVYKFLFKTRSPEPPPNQQAAINYLQLMEGAHILFDKTESLPKHYQAQFLNILTEMMDEFQQNAFPLYVPHPFSQRWTWSKFRSG